MLSTAPWRPWQTASWWSFPPETVYGVAASALHEEAVNRLLTAKGRREDHPITLAIRSPDDALDYVPRMSALGQRLARRCWPGPITLVVDDDHPDSVMRQLPTSVQHMCAPAGPLASACRLIR